jgi:hypothetical protein
MTWSYCRSKFEPHSPHRPPSRSNTRRRSSRGIGRRRFPIVVCSALSIMWARSSFCCGRVTARAGTQAAKPISSSPAADRTRWFQVTHACQPSGARPHATSRAECGGRSRCTAMPAMTRLEHIYESIRGGGGGPVALTVSDPRQGESPDDQLEVPVVVCARGLPLSARGDCGRGALVAALRLVLPRCRRIARRAQPRRGPRDDLAVGADVHA